MEDTMASYLQECFLYKKNGKRILIIAFSAHDFFRKENKRFDFYFLMERSDIDILLVRDFENSWYQEPVKGKTNSSLEMFSCIKEISEKYEKVICLGSSMGGYGALFFGHRIKNAHIISFGPQGFLEKKFRNKFRDYRLDDDMTRAYNVSQNKKMTFLDKVRPICRKVDILYGTSDKKDMAFSGFLSKNKFYKIHYLKKMGHCLVFAFNECGVLEKIINHAIKSDSFNKELRSAEVFSKSLRESLKLKFFFNKIDYRFFCHLRVSDDFSHEFDKILYDIKIINRSTEESVYDVLQTRANKKCSDEEFAEINFLNIPDGSYRIILDVFYKKVNIVDIGLNRFFFYLKKEKGHVDIFNMTCGKKRYAAKIYSDKTIEFSSWSYQFFRPMVICLVFIIKKIDFSFTNKWLSFFYRFFY